MDTIMIIRDSVATCVNKTAEICQPCLKEAGTAWQDVVLQGILYAMILCLAYWVSSGFFKWLNQRSTMKAKAFQEKNNCERKQKSDLQDKLLSYYKDRLIKDKKDDKGNVIVYDEDNCKEYVELLSNMIRELSSNNIKANDKEA